jgi:predicted metal-binding membrane protein
MLRALLRRDRATVLVSLVVVIILAWGYLILGAGIETDEMDMGGGQVMLMAPSWTPNYAALIFLMWAIMMVAMMLPSAAPTILLVAALTKGRNAPTAGLFTLGYVKAAFLTVTDGHVAPADATMAMAAGARALGAKIYRRTRVMDIRRLNTGEWLVTTDQGELRCEYV